MPVLNDALQSGATIEHSELLQRLQPWLRDWGIIALACVIATIAVLYARFALSLWTVEDRIPGNRARVALVGALVATAFAIVGAVDYLRERPKGFRF